MPVAEFFYLRDIPWVDSEYHREQLKEVYVGVLVQAIRIYNQKTYYNMVNCIRVLVDSHRKRGLAQMQREEERLSAIVTDKVDSVAVTYELPVDIKYLDRMVDLLAEQRHMEIVRWIAEGGTLTDFAKSKGVSRQWVSVQRDSAQKYLKELSRICQEIDYQYNVSNKPVFQISKDIKMPRICVCYYLRVLEYLNGKTNIVPKRIQNAKLCEMKKVAECIFSESERKVYEGMIARCCSKSDASKNKLDVKYKECFQVVELAKRYMRAVVDAGDGGTMMWRQKGINIGDLSRHEQDFFVRLYNYVMMEGEKPRITPKLKYRLIERVSTISEFCEEID